MKLSCTLNSQEKGFVSYMTFLDSYIFLSFLKEVEGDLIVEIRMMLAHAQFHLTPSFLLETEPVSENTRSMLLNPGSCPHRKVKKDVPIAAMTKRVTLTS